MKRLTMLVCLLGAVSLFSATTRAEHTRFWRESNFSEFEKGTATGVAVRSDGKLMPALQFTPFSDPNLAYLWALQFDSHGHLFAAGGSDAKVLRIDDSGKSTTFFEAPELAAQAIVFDSKDNLYVATSPDGKVYKVSPDGKKSVFFDPKTKYIWSLAIDSQGTLFVATGDTGEVFAVTPNGQGKLFYQSQERHARSLAISPKGDLLIGTEPDGLILRVGIERKASDTPEAGPAFVIYQTDKAEITSLVFDANGNLYASSVGDKSKTQGPVRELQNSAPAPATISTGGGGTTIVVQTETSQSAPPLPSLIPATDSGGAQVVKIAPDNSPQTIWTSRNNLVFSMGLSSAGKLLLGTSDQGTIVELEGDQVYSSIAKTATAQVTSLLAGANGKIFVATANPGKIFTLGPAYESGGTFLSDPFDAKIFSHWGRLTWGDDAESQGKIELYARSGNTSNPEKNWSAWAGPYTSAGYPMGCPPARFVQWKAVFRDSSAGQPNISWVTVAYQPQNVAPVIDDIALQNPGVRLVAFNQQQGAPNSSPVPLITPQGPGSNPSPAPADAESSATRIEIPPQGFREKGYQSVIWSAHDDNDDALVYTVYYRAAADKSWQLLKDKLTQRSYSWDTTTLPDGIYYLKVVAADSPSNPVGQALSTERESDRFEVANTPPHIDNLRANATANTAKVTFNGETSSGVVAQAQFSVDAGDWQPVFPTGLLSDAPKESYDITIPDLATGEHTVAVQITDRFGNSTTSKTTFTIAAH
jgi:sugar lactone lactonase YvrE